MNEMKPKLAGFWIRLIANLIDWILLTILSTALQYVLMFVVYCIWKIKNPEIPNFDDAFDPFLLQIVNAILYGMFAIPYYVIGHYRWGTTLGKLPLKIYVVSAETFQPITLNQSIVRCVGYLLSYLPMFAGFLMVMIQPRKQGLHDVIAGTQCIRKFKTIPPTSDLAAPPSM